ncbi:hypothetical protein NPIL_241361 [Nephila pilipes]|uniref:Uncharacterized protein n=1 Tax=Nephila pilipes TaxID=299642 RepID=A0A8X6UMW4_NEPPI|nr:hypothetical protein NPIL_241361 [Nephila pilipes]
MQYDKLWYCDKLVNVFTTKHTVNKLPKFGKMCNDLFFKTSMPPFYRIISIAILGEKADAHSTHHMIFWRDDEDVFWLDV